MVKRDEILNMYVTESKSFNVFEHNHCKVKRVSPYTWELYTITEFLGAEVYEDSYGYKNIDKLLEVLNAEMCM